MILRQKALCRVMFLLALSISLLCATVVTPGAAGAQSDLQLDQAGYPIPTGDGLNDFAGVVKGGDVDRVKKMLSDLEAQTGIELAVVTINSQSDVKAGEGQSIEEFSTALFNAWGVGDRAKNDGVMLLVEVKDRAARIELGSGYPSAYDARMQSIMDEKILPFFKEDEYSRGISEGAEGIIASVTRPVTFWEQWGIPLLLGVAIVTLLIIGVSLIRSGKKGWGWAAIAAAGALLILLISIMGKKSKDDDSFGGGSSSGGGATGKW